MTLLVCPRCKQRALNEDDCSQSGIYQSRHLLCNPCGNDEDAEMERAGTNDLPETLRAYGPQNDF